MVFASKNRDYKAFRDESIPLAQESCSVLFAPEFSLNAYPPRAYQRGGFPENPEAPSPARLVIPLEEWAKRFILDTSLPVILIGHSAGAQFLNRVAAYTIGSENGIILMNPGSTVEPSFDIAVPYGFGGEWSALEASRALKAYLARPVFFLLGSEDTKTASFSGNAQAEVMAEGTNRLQRGSNTFAVGRSLARKNGASFNWRIAIVPNVGHDDALMLSSPVLEQTVAAIINRGSLR
ncbi:hypothetical protein AA106555_1672 [Neokomagataea thailandica NBRC 106555]|nr:hypothetical protein AA106555_1672 [Neokomagataea thailandica NBRC 106555]